MKSLTLRAGILLATVAVAATNAAVVSDNFEGTVLDPTKWLALGTVTVGGGYASIDTQAGGNRAYLVGKDEWSVTVGTPLTISGRVNMGCNANDNYATLTIWTRASANYNSYNFPNGTGFLSDGLYTDFVSALGRTTPLPGDKTYFSVREQSNTNTWGPSVSGAVTNGDATPHNAAWDFVITDNGSNFTATFTQVDVQTNVATFTGTTAFSTGFSHVAFGTDGPNIHLQDVTISGTLVPEPASMALIGLGSLAVMLRRRRN